MKIIDITKELFSTSPFPGDPAPSMKLEKTLEKDGYNLTVCSACAHNSTHIDAPCHFVSGGSTAADIELDKCVGKCVVTDNIGSAIEYAERGEKRILLKNVNVTPTQAERLASRILLLGIEGESFGSDSAPGAVHRTLLGAGVVLLENLDLSAARCGKYFLCALPLKMKGSDGSPVRAVLIEE